MVIKRQEWVKLIKESMQHVKNTQKVEKGTLENINS